MKRSTN